MNVQALFGKKAAAAPAKKAAKAPAKPASAPKSKAGTRGWLGGEGGPQTDLDKWYGPNRVLYLPGGLLAREEVPAYLTGELPGDYGYDPLGLGKDTETVAKYRAAELIHARWAMLGAAGALIPEGLEANGADITGGTYFQTWTKMLDGGLLNYFAVPWGIVTNPLPLIAVAAVNTGLMAAVEGFRGKGAGPAGYSPGVGKFDASVFEGMDSLYPGGPFDPLNLAADPEVFAELKVKEIKNGRLAMVGLLAFWIQSYVTGEGPYANFSKHLANPFGYNLVTVIGAGEDRVPSL